MSMLPKEDAYAKKPSAVKAKSRQDVDINKLVRSGIRPNLPTPLYVDLTGLPASRGEAVQRLRELAAIIEANPLPAAEEPAAASPAAAPSAAA